MPNSPLFFLHPCLCDVSRNIRTGMQHSFVTTNEVVAGEGIQVTEETINAIKIALSARLDELEAEKVFVSSTVDDLVQERHAVKISLFNMGFYPIMSESDEFEYGPHDMHSHDHCVNEVLKCKKIVFIIGERYGGKYAGDRYKDIASEIITQSGELIREPSISLVELYAAIKNGLQYYVFVKQSVLNQKKVYGENKMTNSMDAEVFTLINFINHLNTNGAVRGNWFIPFKSEKDLIGRLKAIGLK